MNKELRDADATGTRLVLPEQFFQHKKFCA